MKNLLLLSILFVIAPLMFLSCGEDENILGNTIGGGCTFPSESCSTDKSMVLTCGGDNIWYLLNECNTALGHYCVMDTTGAHCSNDTANTGADTGADTGSDTGADTGSDTGADTADTGADTADTGADTADTGADTADTGNTVDTGDTTDTGNTADTVDTGDTANTGDSANTSDTSDTTPPVDNRSADCMSIADCIKACADSPCATACFEAGNTKGQTEYQAYEDCKTGSGSTNYLEVYEACTTEAEVCGFAGDPAYSIPYGKADLSGNFGYIITTETDIMSNMVIESPFITGNVGTLPIVNVSAAGVAFSYASYTAAAGADPASFVAFQDYNQTALTNPIAYIVGDPTKITVGTNGVGLTGDDTLQLYVAEVDATGAIVCRHGFAVGSVSITAFDTTAGDAGSFIISGSNLDIYSLAAAPVYGGDISDATFVACDPE